ncbi:outer membrane lipoprotein-sorting protein [Saccharicrinis sp. FJH54]|uniref:outer membrane lipoprotein-sorting protein n=1 Tax=Saccharicrinis sp. FJH54 TaxID=3344665 RepID=UPI0035D497ED
MKHSILIIPVLASLCINSFSQDAKAIVKKANDKMEGEKSSYIEMKMTIQRPTYERTIEFKSWTEGTENSLTYITGPAQEKGQAFMKKGNEMWSWNPKISRLIKLPPSMMSQGWMGSDYTNDDILKESSIVVDYSHNIIGEDTIDNHACYRIEMIPNPDAAVVWGKVVQWISKKEYLQMKTEYFDEDNYLVRSELAYDIKEMDGRIIPTRFEIIPADKDNQKTVVELTKIEFNIPIQNNFFSQQNMKRIR